MTDGCGAGGGGNVGDCGLITSSECSGNQLNTSDFQDASEQAAVAELVGRPAKGGSATSPCRCLI